MTNDAYQQLPLRGGADAGLVQQGRSQIEDLVTVATSVVYGMWRYRWPALLVAWLTCMVGWVIVYAMPDAYQANARVYIDAESMIKRVVGDLTVSADLADEINVLTRIMLSRPQLEKTASKAGLDLAATTPIEREHMIDGLSRRIHLVKEPTANIFRISFEDANRWSRHYWIISSNTRSGRGKRIRALPRSF